jgi:hypothetical protein
MSINNQHEQLMEHDAWLKAIEEFRKAFPDADPNDEQFNPLFRALELWGERLVALRFTMPETVKPALDEHKKAWMLADLSRRST